jgi:histidyl-tRNA synthetase
MRFRALPGFRDFYPEEMATRRWIERAWHEASRSAGFQEIDGPVLESLELLTEKSGQEITGQLYAFTDKGGREVALRPEMTPSLARMVGARAAALPKPIKWYCVPQFFRYERPQRGRGREFIQWNVDVIGSDEPAADAEAIAVALQALERLGLGPRDLLVCLNDRRLLRRLLASLDIGADSEAPVLAEIDKLERDGAAAGRLADLLGAERAAVVRGWCESFPRDDAAELEPVLAACDDFGIAEYVEPDLTIVRGLDYYTGPVWEIFDRGRKLRAIAGGGRYDQLIASLGGPALSALGFGMGDMVLGELLTERGLVPETPPRAEAFVVPIGAEMQGPARRVLAALRRANVAADGLYTAVRVGRALKAAQAAGARRAILVGPDEWAEGRVKVKDLDSGEERVVPFDELR